MTIFAMFRRAAPTLRPPGSPRAAAPVPMEPRPPSLILRRSLASGDVALCVRSEPGAAWLEVFRAAADDAKALSELDRLQRVYADPLVRDVFIELTQNEEIET